MTPVALFLWLFTNVAAAQTPPAVPCGGLPGCGDGSPANILVDTFLPSLVVLMLRLAGALAVLAMVVAGFQIFLAQGSEDKFAKGRLAIIYGLGGLAIVGLSQSMVGLIVTEPTVAGAVDEVSAVAVVVNVLVNILNGVFFVVIGYAGILMLAAQGKQDKYETARNIISQAIIAAVIVNIAHALVRVATSFFGI